jgi:ribosomal protein L11 methyltransferase
MSWQNLHLDLTKQQAEAIEEFLNDQGALAVTMTDAADEPLFEPPPGETPLWQSIHLTALFELDFDLKKVLARLAEQFSGNILKTVRIETLEDEDWQRRCLDQFKPRCFAEKLWVVPSWHEVPKGAQAFLWLDPGLAFGTGSHPTTALCLEWLAQHIQPGQEVVDYGTGSGILAIAAIKLGAKHVMAVDNDPQALEAAQDNAQRNHIAAESINFLFPQQLIPSTYDVMVANILANPLIELAPKLSSLIKPQGSLVLSGILENQTQDVIDAYQPWIDFEPPTSLEGWIRLHGKKLCD